MLNIGVKDTTLEVIHVYCQMYFSRSVKFPYYSIFCIQRKTLFMKLSRPTLNFIKQDSIFIGSIGYDACSVNKSLKNFILALDIFLFLKNIYLFDMQDLHCDMQDLSLSCMDSLVVAHRLNCSSDMWHLSFLTTDKTCVPCIARQILNHWTTRKNHIFLFSFHFLSHSINILDHKFLKFYTKNK